MASRELPVTDVETVVFEGDALAIGRDPSNDVVLAEPNVSRFHATVTREDECDRAGRPRIAQRHAAGW